jgi:DNA (cytosine-5)-methyltransferase 3A
MNKSKNVLSLFDGHSTGMFCLNAAGIPVKNYFASEIDKYAMAVSAYHFPEIIQIGDVLNVRAKDLPKIDVLIAGSPCQGFSVAGKNRNFEDPRSKLLFEFIRLLKECDPEYFFLENVRMPPDCMDVVSEALGCDRILVNSSLVSAQNRQRFYWTNIDTFGKPADKGIYLKDIIEDDVDARYFLKNPKFKLNEVPSLDIITHNLQPRSGKGKGGKGHLQKEDGKRYCLKANPGQAVELVVGCALRGRGDIGETKQTLEINETGKSNSLTTVQKDSLIQISKMDKANCLTPDAYLARGERNRDENGNAVLTSMHERRIRRLTPIECERLQTVPDNYTSKGLDVRCQTWFNGGSECQPIWRKSWLQYAKLKAAISPSQIKSLDSAISITFGNLGTELQALNESLLISLENVSLMGVQENNKPLKVCVSNIIKNGSESKLQSIKNVQFVIEKLDTVGGEGCAYAMRLLKLDTETLSILKELTIESSSLMVTKIENTIKLKEVSGCIELLLKKYSEENCEKERLCIMLILINLTIIQSIFMCAKTIKATHISINSLNLLQGNLLETELLALKTENIIEISDSARYRALGNGWTADVVTWFFEHMKSGKKKDLFFSEPIFGSKEK